MAKTVTDLIAKINQFELELKANMPAIVNEMAGVVLSYTITQIRRNRGLLSNAQYSNKSGVPAFLYKGKNNDYPRALNAAGRAYINRKIKEGLGKRTRNSSGMFQKSGFINWKGLRAAQGLQVAKVDLTYTGRMFQQIGIIDTRAIGDVYQAVIGGLDLEVKNKLKWNIARYGNFLKPSEKALELAQQRGVQRVQEIYNRIFK